VINETIELLIIEFMINAITLKDYEA